MLNANVCKKARLSRDARFDGKFFVAVKTTGIYCRPICPATAPKEANVAYFRFAEAAANAGYRPCLRCHPDSAPGSPAWQGVDTTLENALRLINEGALQEDSLQGLSQQLGITDRYLRQLFEQRLGVSPKIYALNQQCLFAKKLLHQTRLPINQVALASGFNSVRRFNDCFRKQTGLTPSAIRRAAPSKTAKTGEIQLKLFYRPPYDWDRMHRFFVKRHVPTLEWVDNHCYGRTFEWAGCFGYFTAKHVDAKNRFDVSVKLTAIKQLKPIIGNIRRILDLDADLETVESCINENLGAFFKLNSGMRLPGIWSVFESGIRAILGQQVSVTAAHNLLRELVLSLGEAMDDKKLFPQPLAIANSDLAFLKMPESRKQTLRNLAQHYLTHDQADDLSEWLALKGIGPWTVNYARLRGLSEPDVYLAGDLGLKKAMNELGAAFDPALAAPWRSYLTLQIWSQL